MKKILFLSLLLIGLAAVASATPVTCSVLMAPNTTGASTTMCTVTAPTGFYISALTLTGSDDYTGYQSGNPTASFSGTLSLTPGFTTPLSSLTFCNVVTSGTNSVPCAILPNPDPASNTNTTITTFSLQLINAGNAVSGGVVTGDSIVLNLDWAVTEIPSTGVPEPSTLGLTGSALLGLSFLIRKRSRQ
jgi:hypothetical protein